jgi:serine/threonine protein phosphatase PrpC
LALSRAFGDFQYKDQPKKSPAEQAVSCFPDISTRARSDKDKFIILACDGIWDCLTNEECVQSLEKKLKDLTDKDTIATPVEQMLGEILAEDTETGIGTDNMTAILIKFKNTNVGSE